MHVAVRRAYMMDLGRWLFRSSYFLLLLRATPAHAEEAPAPRRTQLLPPVRAMAAPPASPPKFLGLRLPAFIAFGVAGVSTGGAVATRLAASSSLAASDCGSNCSDVRVSRSRTLVTASTIFAGVAAAGIGTGIVILFCSPSEAERGGVAPTLRLKVTSQRAVAGMTWKF